MKIQILSDLHLESPKSYDTFLIPPKAPILALLGDIGNAVHHKDEFLSFLKVQLQNFRVVFLVPGNHEAYHSSWPETISTLKKFDEDFRTERERGLEEMGEFILLDRNIYRPSDPPDVAVLGCSLFSYIPDASVQDVSFGLQDFYSGVGTSGWTVEDHNSSHKRDLEWLNQTVASLEKDETMKRIMILSHWSPTTDERSIYPSYRGGTRIQSGFMTDLSSEECFSSSKVKVWAFGHTHFNCDFLVERYERGGIGGGVEAEGNGERAGRLRLVANQRGNYFRQAARFKLEKVIEL